MSLIQLPQRFWTQPQYPAPLKDPDFWRLVDIQGLLPLGTAAATVTRTLNGTAKLGTGRAGKCVDFVVDGDWLSYGSNPALQLSTMTGLVVVEMTAAATYSALFNTNVIGSFAGGFVIRTDTTGTVTALKQDTAVIGTTVKTVKKGLGVSNIAWSYNNVTGKLRIAVDGVLESFTSAQTFNQGPVGRNSYYGDATQAGAHKQYLFALSAECDRVTNAELIAWSNDPWQIFKAPAKKIWVSTSPDVTISLSGQVVTGSQGSLGVDTSVDLSGKQASFSTGTLTPGAGAVVALAGQSSSFAQGSLSPATDIALTGQPLSSSPGGLGVSLDAGLSGQALALSQGTIGTQGDVTVALTGADITASQGTLSPPQSPSEGGHFAGVGVVGKKRKKRDLVDRDRDEIRHHLKLQLDEAYAALFQPEIPAEIQEQAAAVIKQLKQPDRNDNIPALQQEVFHIRQMLTMWEQQARLQRQTEEDEELLMMFL